MRIFYLSVMLAFLPAAAFAQAQSFDLDRGIGDSTTGRGAGGGFESDIDLSEIDRTSQTRRLNALKGVSGDQSTLANAYGNMITIQAQTGSHVNLNTVQYNTGNQTVTVNNLNGFGGTRYNNVTEEQPVQDYPETPSTDYPTSGYPNVTGGYYANQSGNSALPADAYSSGY